MASLGGLSLAGVLATSDLKAQTFTEVTNTPFIGVDTGSVAVADVDGDDDLDIFIVGRGESNDYYSILYLNDGSGNFTKDEVSSFQGIAGSCEFSDVDDDGDFDIIITGFSNPSRVTKLYKNNGSGIFTEDTSVPFDQASFSKIAVSDLNGDGVDEVVLIGSAQTSPTTFARVAKVYTNDGDGNFTEDTSTSFKGVLEGDISIADIDKDGDNDILFNGSYDSTPISQLHLNDGNGNFQESASNSFTGLSNGASSFSDMDGDGDTDLIMTGRDGTNAATANQITSVYLNDGTGLFTEQTGDPFPNVYLSDLAFIDIDNDGDLDVLITGRDADYIKHGSLFLNDGAANFTELESAEFESVQWSSVDFINIDGDRDEDVIITGLNGSFQKVTKLYKTDSAPEFVSLNVFEFDENHEGLLFDINANNGDSFIEDEGIVYSIESIQDGSLFNVDAASGEVTFMSTPDFENSQDSNNDNVYVLAITADDGANQVSQEFSISITDLNESPEIANQSFSIDEGSAAGTLVGVIQAEDPEDASLLFKITDGNQTNAFALDEMTGSLTINDPENLKFDSNPVFELTIRVTDGILETSANISVNLNQVLSVFGDEDFLSIFPNPASEIVYLNGVSELLKSSIKVVNISGIEQNVKIQQIESKILINIENLESGIYFVVTKIKSKRVSTTFVKE